MKQVTVKLKLIYTDNSNHITPASAGRARYRLMLMDDINWFSWIFLLKEKEKTLTKFKDFVTWIKRQTDYKAKRLWSNNGKEYDNKKAKD